MIIPEKIAENILRKHGEDAFKASKRPEILTLEIKSAGGNPDDFRLRSQVTLALLPKRVRRVS